MHLGSLDKSREQIGMLACYRNDASCLARFLLVEIMVKVNIS